MNSQTVKKKKEKKKDRGTSYPAGMDHYINVVSKSFGCFTIGSFYVMCLFVWKCVLLWIFAYQWKSSVLNLCSPDLCAVVCHCENKGLGLKAVYASQQFAMTWYIY